MKGDDYIGDRTAHDYAVAALRLIGPGWKVEFVECTHERMHDLKGPFGPHPIKRICIDCLKFIDWVAAPETVSRKREILDRLFVLRKGPLFPPRDYVDKKGVERTWDDAEYFAQMTKLDGKWSPQQEALLLRRFDEYEKNGHTLRDKADTPAPGVTAPQIDGSPF